MILTTIHAVKTHLSRLIQRACNGEDIVIARGKTPLVHLVPIDAPEQGRRFGALSGKARVGDAFFELLPVGELDTWNQ